MSTTQPNLLLTKPEKTSIKRVLMAPVIVLVFLIAVFLGGIRWIGERALSSTPIFHQTKSGWQQLPAPLAISETLRVSSNGLLWVRTEGRSAMSCWDGKAWKYYTRADLGMQTGYINTTFALDGEQVWDPTNQ